MSDSRPRRLRRVSLITVFALLLTTAVSTVVIAAHNFTDVPEDNTFHQDIEWISENRVTRGCNPPDNTEYCPGENVTREQMSAFMRRLTETFGTAGNQVTDDSDPVTVDSTEFEQLLSVQVTPMAEAQVALNAHNDIEVATDVDPGDGSFEAVIARDSCDGEVVGTATWASPLIADATANTTLSITGYDEVTEETTYVLCAAKQDDATLDGTVNLRGLTATWSPDGGRG